MNETFACTGKNCPFMRDVKRCTAPHCENRTPPTNGDRIRAASDEWLAECLALMDKRAKGDGVDEFYYKKWLDWLKSPVEV